MNKLYKIVLVFSIAILLSSCCDDTCQITSPTPACNVKNNALIVFQSGVVKTIGKASDGSDSIYYLPNPEYAVETFQFPDNNTSSGNMPSDSRFKSGPMIIAAKTFTNQNTNYLAVVRDVLPNNADIVGDILVDSVYVDSNPMQSYAILRFAGDLAKFSQKFESENSGKFCDEFLSKYGSNIKELNSIATKFGSSLPSQASVNQYEVGDISVLLNDVVVTGIAVPSDIVSDLLTSANSKARVRIKVTPGDVYYYKARNGREFALQISGMALGLFPNDSMKKKRVYIMFNPI